LTVAAADVSALKEEPEPSAVLIGSVVPLVADAAVAQAIVDWLHRAASRWLLPLPDDERTESSWQRMLRQPRRLPGG
jgi:hypothetical protein